MKKRGCERISTKSLTRASKHAVAADLGCSREKLRSFLIAKSSHGEFVRMVRSKKSLVAIFAFLLTVCSLFAQEPAPPVGASPQTGPAYTPKFKGDPAHSDSEAAALAYMRGVIRAEKQFNKQYGHYALTLNELVHSGSFTKRMVNPDRGDYTASYKGKKESYVLTMTPKMMDAQHRSFYADDDGKIRGDDSKPAGPDSPIVK